MGSVMVEAKTKYKNINPSKALFLHLRSMEIKQNKTKKSRKEKKNFPQFFFSFCGLLFGGKFVMRMLHNEMLQKINMIFLLYIWNDIQKCCYRHEVVYWMREMKFMNNSTNIHTKIHKYPLKRTTTTKKWLLLSLLIQSVAKCCESKISLLLLLLLSCMFECMYVDIKIISCHQFLRLKT